MTGDPYDQKSVVKLPAVNMSHKLAGSVGPQTARMYDYYLGGKDNFAEDRAAAQEVLDEAPDVVKVARANRHFLHVATEYVARELGIDQFLDLGTGVPTQPNTHEIAQYHQPEARLLYVDHDPIVRTYAQALMTSAPGGHVEYIEADLRQPETILKHPYLDGEKPVFDLKRPVAVVTVAILHFITDDDRPTEILRALMEPMAPGSCLVLSHVTEDFEERLTSAASVYKKRELPVQLRSGQEILALLKGQELDLLEPGMQPVNRWWPGRPARLAPIPLYSDRETSCYGLVARKP